MKKQTLLLLASVLLLSVSGVFGYSLQVNYSGSSFFDGFDFFTAGDPTHGFVHYVNKAQAQQMGLINTNGGAVYIGSDHTTVATGGRASVRLTSNKVFNGGLFIMDLTHMPVGCGTWPAWWTVGPNWPNSGEIDIIENVNNADHDQTTLHTNPGCTMNGEDHSKFSGNMIQANCAAAGNQGCAITTGAGTYGDGFNNNKGGVFAMEWTDNFIQSFFFPRNNIPKDIVGGNPNPSGWGKPYAYFQLGAQCPKSHFQNHQIVIDLTFCGDWAGAVFNQQCPGKGACNDFVSKNPSAFANAFWSINYIKVFK